MRPAELHVCLRNACHSDLVISAGQEGRECRNERNLASCGQTRRRAYHVLFGNEHFKKTCGLRFQKFFGEGRILCIAVERHNAWIFFCDFHKRVTVSFACRGGFPNLARDCDVELDIEWRYRETRTGSRNEFIWAKGLLQLRQCLRQILFRNRFTVPTFPVFDQGNAFAFQGLCQKSARSRSAVTSKKIERVQDLAVIMTIDRLGEPSEGAKLISETLYVELVHGSLALSQTVDVDDCVQI